MGRRASSGWPSERVALPAARSGRGYASERILTARARRQCGGITMVVIATLNMNLPDDMLSHSCNKGEDVLDCFGTRRAVACCGVLCCAVPRRTSGCRSLSPHHMRTLVCAGINCQSMQAAGATDCTAKEEILKYLKSECVKGFKTNLYDCDCPPDSYDDKCVCNDDAPAQRAFDTWRLMMLLIGAVGCGVCFLVAAVSFCAARKKGSLLWVYSTCSGLLTFLFGAIGAVFLCVGLLMTVETSALPGTGVFNGTDTGFSQLRILTDCDNYVEENNEGDETSQCLVKTICSAMNLLKFRFTLLGYGLGIPFFLGGFMMFIACYACCCCKASFLPPGAATEEGEDGKPSAVHADTVITVDTPAGSTRSEPQHANAEAMDRDKARDLGDVDTGFATPAYVPLESGAPL